MTDSYLRVQHQRYRDDFAYHIDVDPALLEASIVKLTLQPLVENAIYHGIRKVRRPGRIEISGRLEEGTVILSVWDNGQGMLHFLHGLHSRTISRRPGPYAVCRVFPGSDVHRNPAVPDAHR